MVQNLTQMSQFIDDIHTILWVIPIQISWKKYSKKEQMSWYSYITICSIDSRDKIDSKDYWLILLDESDTYLGADARRLWIQSISPEYLYAMSWTIKINHVDDTIFKLYYGKKTELKLNHYTPAYHKIISNFEYYPNELDKFTKQFYETKIALYWSSERNDLIIKTAIKYWVWRKGIIFTEHVEHAKYLSDELSRRWIKTFTLVGEVIQAERERIRQEAKEYGGDCIIVWSVKILGRWFDIPELSFAILTTCEKFESNMLQYIWRIIREHPNKKPPLFIDIVDHLCPILLSQSRSRIKNARKSFPDIKISIS